MARGPVGLTTVFTGEMLISTGAILRPCMQHSNPQAKQETMLPQASGAVGVSRALCSRKAAYLDIQSMRALQMQ